MKKITLLILAAMFCIGTLTLLGCADEPEVVELEPVEEVLEEANIEEEVVELEPEPEPLYFGEEIEPTVSEEELNALIAAARGSSGFSEREIEVMLDYANARPLPNRSSYDTAFMAWQSLIRYDYQQNNLQVLRAMRDSRTNSVLRDKYDDLISAMEKLRTDGNVQGYIDTLKIIDAGLHPEVVGKREILPFFQSILGALCGDTDVSVAVSINDEIMTVGAAFATNQLPIQRKYRDIRRKIDAGEEVSFKLMPPNLVQI